MKYIQYNIILFIYLIFIFPIIIQSTLITNNQPTHFLPVTTTTQTTASSTDGIFYDPTSTRAYAECSTKYGPSYCQFGLYCLDSNNNITNCLPLCQNCQVPIPPQQFLCAISSPTQCTTHDCIYTSDIDQAMCKMSETKLQILNYFTRHQCHCDSQCSIDKLELISPPNTSQQQQIIPINRQPELSKLFYCSISYPERVQICSYEEYIRHNNCIQEDDLITYDTKTLLFTSYVRNQYTPLLWSQQGSSDPITGQLTLPNELLLPTRVVSADRCPNLNENETLIYHPDDRCEYQWGCLEPNEQGILDEKSSEFDFKCQPSSCRGCGDILSQRILCRSTITMIDDTNPDEPITIIQNEFFDVKQLQVFQNLNLGCYLPNIPIITTPSTCECEYHCIGIKPFESPLDLDQFQYYQPFPFETYPTTHIQVIPNNNNYDQYCYILPTADELQHYPCDDKIIAQRQIFCFIDTYYYPLEYCQNGYTLQPPQGIITPSTYPTTLPLSSRQLTQLNAPICPVQLLCRLGNNAGIPIIDTKYYQTLNIPTTISITEPQQRPIQHQDIYPNQFTECNSICTNICLNEIPISVTKSCFVRKNCIPKTNEITLSDGTITQYTYESCTYIQLPFNSTRCDNIDNNYQSRGILPTNLLNNGLIYTSHITTQLCPCDLYCSPTPTLETPIFSTYPKYHTPTNNNNTVQLPNFIHPSVTYSNQTIYSCTTQQSINNTPQQQLPPQPYPTPQTTPLQYGFLQIPTAATLLEMKMMDNNDGGNTTPIINIFQTIENCFQPYLRDIKLLSIMNPSTPQIFNTNLCTDIIDSTMVTKPLILPMSLDHFYCTTKQIQTQLPQITKFINNIQSQCQPDYVCSTISQPDVWSECINDKGENIGFEPTCTNTMCGEIITRNVQCQYSSNVNVGENENMLFINNNNNDSTTTTTTFQPLSSPTPIHATTTQISDFYTSIYRPLLETPPTTLLLNYTSYLTTIDTIFNNNISSQLKTNCQVNSPIQDDFCQCEPKYYCGPYNTRLQPIDTWNTILQPCFETIVDDTIIPPLITLNDTFYGFNTNICNGCIGTNAIKKRDIFCKQLDGTFIIANDPTTPNQCTQLSLQIPIQEQLCQGEIECKYMWRCPMIQTSITQDNWGLNILLEPTCDNISLSFGDKCYFPTTISTTPGLVRYQNQTYAPSYCTNNGLQLRKRICVATIIDSIGKTVPISIDTSYDKQCSTYIPQNVYELGPIMDISNTNNHPIPIDQRPCINLNQCNCENSILTGPNCNLSPTLTNLIPTTIYPQPQSALNDKTYIHVQSNTIINIQWDYIGQSATPIYFYLDNLYLTTTSESLSPYYLGSVLANVTSTSLFIPYIDGVITSKQTPAQLIAYVGFDSSSTRTNGIKSNIGLHIIPSRITCGEFVCARANLQIWDIYHKQPAYDWSDSIEACQYTLQAKNNNNNDDNEVITTSTIISTQSTRSTQSTQSTQFIPLQLPHNIKEPTPVASMSTNTQQAIITGCLCVPSTTLTMDNTCTIANQCQNINFNVHEFNNNGHDNNNNSTTNSFSTQNTSPSSTLPQQHKQHPTTYHIPSHSHYNIYSPQQATPSPSPPPSSSPDPLPIYQSPLIGSPITISGSTCGKYGFVPIQHHWSSVETLSIPPSCSPQCECLNPSLSSESKCKSCTKRCNTAAEGGTLNATICQCQCNLGFYGDSCSLCAAYSLFQIDHLSDTFVNDIWGNNNKKNIFFQTLSLHIATLLQVSRDSVIIDINTAYMRSSTLKFVVTLTGNCFLSTNSNPSPSSKTIQFESYNQNSTLLYLSTAMDTSLFTIFPRWNELLNFYKSTIPASSTTGTYNMIRNLFYGVDENDGNGRTNNNNQNGQLPPENIQFDDDTFIIHTHSYNNEQYVEEDTFDYLNTEQSLLSYQQLQQQQQQQQSQDVQQSSTSIPSTTSSSSPTPITKPTKPHKQSHFSTLQSTTTTPTSTTTPIPTTSLFATTSIDTTFQYNQYNNFFTNGILSLTGGKLITMSSLYAPKCVGSECPNGDNPYDTVQCIVASDCISTPDPNPNESLIDDAVLYIIIAVVLVILAALILFIVLFCCFCTKSVDVNNANTNEQSQDKSNNTSSSGSTNVNTNSTTNSHDETSSQRSGNSTITDTSSNNGNHSSLDGSSSLGDESNHDHDDDNHHLHQNENQNTLQKANSSTIINDNDHHHHSEQHHNTNQIARDDIVVMNHHQMQSQQQHRSRYDDGEELEMIHF